VEQATDVSCHLKDYNIPVDDLPALVDGAMKQARLFVTNPKDMTEADVRSIYEKAFS
jgi:alcohol dehydrogenase class IV